MDKYDEATISFEKPSRSEYKRTTSVDELWGAMATDDKGSWLLPPLDDDGTDVIMCWPNKEQCEQGIKHYLDNWCDDEKTTVAPIRLSYKGCGVGK